MSGVATSRPFTRRDPVRPFKVGAYGFVFLGTGHLALSAAAALATRTPERREVDTVMRESTYALLGLERTVLDVFNGMSIAMAFLADAGSCEPRESLLS
ncbi:hypothetical protein ACH4KN_06655 [Streptomyces sp. NPDC017546]|uniref:LIC_13387 family protein n=1 Tax=unclassified Streptomyces TaxID=2593676 RepID=UPI002362BBDF|nr:hypothetical protein [Streptomyces sp. MMBL 11-1]